MGKSPPEKKTKISRKSVKETPKKSREHKVKEKDNKKEKNSKKSAPKKQNEEYSSASEGEEDYEELILPGQNHPTPPAGDATRAFYESLLEQKPNSLMAMKYCVEYGCLDAEKAKEFKEILEKNKKKKK